MDLYRINSPEELYQIDYENYFYPDGITVIEWAENADYLLPKNLVKVVFPAPRSPTKEITWIELIEESVIQMPE